MMIRIVATAGAVLCVILIGACGDTKMDRGLSGAGIGAAGGAIAGVLLGSPGTGALLGAAVGGAAGALTDSDQIDLGDPVWE